MELLPRREAAAYSKIINFLIDFLNNLCYNEGGKTRTITHSQDIHSLIFKLAYRLNGGKGSYYMKYLNYSDCGGYDYDYYDSDREVDTDFFTKAELEEFAAAKHYKILEDLPGNDLEVELPGEKKEDHT